MDKLIEKLDSYNILNNILPGIVFDFLLKRILEIEIINGNLLENIFIYYFIGMIISRIGSIVIEPIGKKIGLVKYIEYNQYIKASRKDKKVDTLSEMNNVYRTLIATCMIVLVIFLIRTIFTGFSFSSESVKVVLLVAIIVIFIVAYRKQTEYVVNRVKKVNEEENEK